MDRTAKAEADLILHKITRTNHWGTRVQTGEWVGIFWRFLWYTGAGLLVSSIAALAVRFWLPESMHMPLFLVVHSLCGGVVAVSLLRTLSRAKTGSTLHNESSANQRRLPLVAGVVGNRAHESGFQPNVRSGLVPLHLNLFPTSTPPLINYQIALEIGH